LALVLLLDQFPRQIWRDTAMAFAGDSQALALSLRAVERGWLEAEPEKARRDVDHLMALGCRIHSREWIAAAPTGVRPMVMDALAALHRQQLRPRAGMAWLASALAATAFPFQGRLESLAVTGGW
jgi:hypothetical protein